MKDSLIQERISRLAEGIQADCLFAAPEPRGRAGCNCRRGDVRCCRQTFHGSAYRQQSGNRDQNLIISEWAVIREELSTIFQRSSIRASAIGQELTAP